MSEIILTEAQAKIKRAVLNEIRASKRSGKNNFSILQGTAGTGKSTLTAEIAKAVYNNNWKVKCTAPTHKAVAVIQSMLRKAGLEDVETSTIHSHLKLKIKEDYDTGKVTLFPDLYNKDKSKNLDLLIIDEFSMINSELDEYIKLAVENGTVKHVLYIGDSLQLPPVDDEYSVLDETPLENVHTLVDVIRQAADNPIIQMAQSCVKAIKTQKSFHKVVNELEQYCENLGTNAHVKFVSDEMQFLEECIKSEDSVVLSFTNKKVNTRNAVIRHFVRADDANEDGVLAPYLPGDYLVLQGQYSNGPFTFTNNQTVEVISAQINESGVFKSWDVRTDMGVISVIHDDSHDLFKRTLIGAKDKAKYEKDKDERNKAWRQFFALQSMFADVKYHYASTVHKSQGSTYKSVFLDLSDFVSSNNDILLRLLYVGITRTSDKLQILW